MQVTVVVGRIVVPQDQISPWMHSPRTGCPLLGWDFPHLVVTGGEMDLNMISFTSMELSVDTQPVLHHKCMYE